MKPSLINGGDGLLNGGVRCADKGLHWGSVRRKTMVNRIADARASVGHNHAAKARVALYGLAPRNNGTARNNSVCIFDSAAARTGK
ncbi:MAG: hypothetical protein JWO70_1100 [Betaproteobacteria bacterium]|nr:hypothetical protein [Betaproteobacteria bacterium]